MITVRENKQSPRQQTNHDEMRPKKSIVFERNNLTGMKKNNMFSWDINRIVLAITAVELDGQCKVFGNDRNYDWCLEFCGIFFDDKGPIGQSLSKQALPSQDPSEKAEVPWNYLLKYIKDHQERAELVGEEVEKLHRTIIEHANENHRRMLEALQKLVKWDKIEALKKFDHEYEHCVFKIDVPEGDVVVEGDGEKEIGEKEKELAENNPRTPRKYETYALKIFFPRPYWTAGQQGKSHSGNSIKKILRRYRRISDAGLTPKVHQSGLFWERNWDSKDGLNVGHIPEPWGFIVQNFVPETLWSENENESKRNKEKLIEKAREVCYSVERLGYYGLDTHGENFLVEYIDDITGREEKVYIIDFDDVLEVYRPGCEFKGIIDLED